MPGLLKETDREALKSQLAQMTNDVKLVFFAQALDCEYCPITKQVLEEVASLSDKIQLETLNFAIDKEQVNKYKIARIPAIAVVRVENRENNGLDEVVDRDYGIRYYGIPAGYEFAALIGDILDISAGESGLSPESKSALAKLKEPLHLQVFTTPT
jgi:glutaredoxin-like protein